MADIHYHDLDDETDDHCAVCHEPWPCPSARDDRELWRARRG